MGGWGKLRKHVILSAETVTFPAVRVNFRGGTEQEGFGLAERDHPHDHIAGLTP